MKALFKTTIVIWSEYNPEGAVSLEDLARDASQGEAYCSHQETVAIDSPTEDSDWDGTEFFGVAEDTIKCPKCGISVPDVPEDATIDEMLCNACHDKCEDHA